MQDMLEFLRSEGIDERLIAGIEAFRREHPVTGDERRIPKPHFYYYGKEIWLKALTALLAGENLLLVGPKATGKNVLAENLSAVFARPQWDVSEVVLREGPITQCAKAGGFGILDEINMAKNESLAVLHATLDFRRIIDVPGYDRISLQPGTRFIATMNYGYAGTRELNEALASRFMVIQMPVITVENLKKLLLAQHPTLQEKYADQLAQLFGEIRAKCESAEISTKALDLRGLLAAVSLVENGLCLGDALELGIVNKSFDDFERQLVNDIIAARIDGSAGRGEVFRS